MKETIYLISFHIGIVINKNEVCDFFKVLLHIRYKEFSKATPHLNFFFYQKKKKKEFWKLWNSTILIKNFRVSKGRVLILDSDINPILVAYVKYCAKEDKYVKILDEGNSLVLMYIMLWALGLLGPITLLVQHTYTCTALYLYRTLMPPI